MSPDERAALVNAHLATSLDGLDPAFRARVEATGQRILSERGMLNSEPR
jgi:hypothetical protein